MQAIVYVAFVHNNNQVRNDYMRAKIESMVASMQTDYQVKQIEVSYQSEILPQSLFMSLISDVINQHLGSKWLRYRHLKSSKFVEDVGFLKSLFVKYLFNPNGERFRRKRNRAIEVAVSDKHIRAWYQFLDTGADYLIVLEDDVVFKDDSNVRIKKLLGDLSKNYSNRACYVDLGGGFKLADLMINSLETKYVDNYRHYQKPVTNTTCAYLVSRDLITKFNEILIRKPLLRFISVDWMINSLFILWGKDVSRVICMHADPTIFNHGTFTGEYVSWH
ncbi:glycosyltransferase family 25 protein [Candidatus Methylopumilus turicensis]|uniref:Glycosyl transferase family 25 domain-containing protein n=1 Tax=Candidatus Methylopumilus turicensis TaxID=1581680 RepID=A0A0B7IY15_9PROT|nr:glycosyltransferase family 25 protein [Candidatus Methylopumilus turicensis]CEN55998.1 protein of unknown function [Candidatus Methylopumilus turicensis]